MQKMSFSKILFVFFSSLMILFVAYSLLFPVESDYWLVRNGFAIIMLEFFTIFIIPLSGMFQDKQERLKAALIATVIFFMAFVFTIITKSIIPFAYFVISSGIKFTNSKQEFEEEISVFPKFGKMIIAIILGIMLARIFSPILLAFPYQQELLKNTFLQDAKDIGGSIIGSIVDSPGIIALWGIFYFILMIIFELTNIIKPIESKQIILRQQMNCL